MKKVKIALVGLGVVGRGVYDILTEQKDTITGSCFTDFELVAASSRTKKDFLDEKRVKFVENALDLANDAEIDIIIEVVGNAPNIQELWRAALKNGKKIVTANKALLAEFGLEMAALAEENGGRIAYEAACAGAIPVVKMFKEGFAGNKIEAFCGILNGTANYILTKMGREGVDFAVALKAAQEAGYAEADPTFDVEGIDAAHKLAILSAVASKTKPIFDKIHVEGVTKITCDDIKIAAELGYKIKLLGIFDAKKGQQTIYPALVNEGAKIAAVDDSFNAILAKGNNFDENLVIGRGAGSFETASAVVADVVDFVNERFSYDFGVKVEDLGDFELMDIEDRKGKYFVTLILDDKNALDKAFLDEIKVEKSHFAKDGEKMVAGLITGDLVEKDLKKLLAQFEKYHFIRVEEL